MPVHVLKPTSKVLYTSNFVLIGSNKGRKYSIDESKLTNVKLLSKRFDVNDTISFTGTISNQYELIIAISVCCNLYRISLKSIRHTIKYVIFATSIECRFIHVKFKTPAFQILKSFYHLNRWSKYIRRVWGQSQGLAKNKLYAYCTSRLLWKQILRQILLQVV